jgi:hypothetical protein
MHRVAPTHYDCKDMARHKLVLGTTHRSSALVVAFKPIEKLACQNESHKNAPAQLEATKTAPATTSGKESYMRVN